MEYFFIRSIVLVSYYQTLLLIFHQLSHIFPKQREWWIGHHNISLFQQLNTFLAAEVAVALQWLDANLLGIGNMVAAFVAFVDEIHGLLALVLTE